MSHQSPLSLIKFPVITKGEAEQIEYNGRFNRGERKTIEVNGIYFDIRGMSDDEAEKAWEELHSA